MHRLLIGLAVTAVIGCCTLALLGLRSAVVDSMVFGGAAVCDFLQARPARRLGGWLGGWQATPGPSPTGSGRRCQRVPVPAPVPVGSWSSVSSPARTRCARSARGVLAPSAVGPAVAAFEI